jgi:hypothetical protein
MCVRATQFRLIANNLWEPCCRDGKACQIELIAFSCLPTDLKSSRVEGVYPFEMTELAAYASAQRGSRGPKVSRAHKVLKVPLARKGRSVLRGRKVR